MEDQQLVFPETESEDKRQLPLTWHKVTKDKCPYRVSFVEGSDKCSLCDMSTCNYEFLPIVECDIWKEILREWLEDGEIDEDEKYFLELRNNCSSEISKSGGLPMK